MNLEIAKETLILHSRSEKNGIFPEVFQYQASITNPICGDHVELRLFTQNDVIEHAGHKANACAICSASASLLCEEVKGLSMSEAKSRALLFEKSVMETSDRPWPVELQNLNCFEHLRVNPARKVCALLPWTTLKKALKESEGH